MSDRICACGDGYGECNGCEAVTPVDELAEGHGLCRSCDQPDYLSDEPELAVTA